MLRSFRPTASKKTEPKQAPLRPAPSQVLELPGGAWNVAQARWGTAPASRSEVRGQNLRCRHNNCEHQPIEAAAWVFDDAHRPIRSGRRPPLPSVSDFSQSRQPCSLPFPSLVPSGSSFPEALTRRRGHCDRTAWLAPRTASLKSSPSQAFKLAEVSRTDCKNINTPRA